MKRLLTACALACALSACAVTSLPEVPASPSVLADQTTADERGGIAIESLYTLAARSGALAFRLGLVARPTQPETQRPDFCALVRTGTFEPADRGAQMMVLECRLRAVRDAGRDAYDAGNATSYEQLLAQASRIADQIAALTR